MPNWTVNTIRALGTPQDLRAFLEALKWEDKVFDFNRIIPMPELLEHTAKDLLGQRVKSRYVIDTTVDGPLEKNIRPFTEDEEAVLKSIGHSNWYDWSVEHWGTKWNACYSEIDETGSASGYVEIRFETAWAAPVPVFQRMFELFPQISFVCVWKHEGERKRHSLKRLVAKRGEGGT